jgi:branched-subunit amino acid aminotransferase/4-amino-4-deoxychorismate lyase
LLAEALRADEAFVTGTLTEIGAAVEIDGTRIGQGRAGPVTRRLQEAFRALVRQECGA